jgi:ring-1,2-phenylacetyl-CoA epoxidase subunit PaaD
MVNRLSADRAWEVLARVPDPEIPVISVTELGIVRDVRACDDAIEVVVTPTYSGCPATEMIRQSIEQALHAAGAHAVRIEQRLSPAWTTDWITPAAKDKLARYGIAPPHAVRAGSSPPHTLDAAAVQPIFFSPRTIACPRCASLDTERLSQFGSTACKALYRCRACRGPFEYFKPL